jgi:3-hydroxyacyl-CoA dehydrogenase
VTTIKRVAVVGCGTVGASWTPLFLAHGLDVAAYDPSPSAEERLHSFVDHALEQLAELGIRGKGELRFSSNLADAHGHRGRLRYLLPCLPIDFPCCRGASAVPQIA